MPGTVERVFAREGQRHRGAKKERMLSLLIVEMRDALAKGVCTAYPLVGMRVTVVQEIVEKLLAQQDACACRQS